jgi:16S rRNA (cytosine967-C5)-methyltransferase
VAEASRRLGLTSVHTVVADGRAPPVRPGGFDRVLVDAPCSGLGVLRRRPESRWRLQPEDVDRAAVLQRQLLAAAVSTLRPGGLLAYSVCTLSRAETADIDEWLAGEFPPLAAEAPPGPPWRPLGRGALLLPQAAGTDGMYLLLLRTA